MIFFFAGAKSGSSGDPRHSVGRDLTVLSTYWDFHKKKKPKFILQIKLQRKQRKEKSDARHTK